MTLDCRRPFFSTSCQYCMSRIALLSKKTLSGTDGEISDEQLEDHIVRWPIRLPKRKDRVSRVTGEAGWSWRPRTR